MSRTEKPKPNTPVRCAIYTRKSHEEGLEQEFNSLDAQREAGEAFVASQKSEGLVCLPQHYDDGGFSGGNTERPALQRLLADIRAGRIDCVVVYKIDRLSRSLLDFLKMVEVFDQHGVSFISVTQQMNTSSPMGRLMLNVLLSFAQFEREIIGERIRDKIAAQRRKGKWAGGKPVLGYDIDRSGPSPKLVVNAEEAARVREIFGLYLQHGSMLPVVQELARRGWLNKQWQTRKGSPRGGRPFDKGNLHALLTNPLYIGQIRHKEQAFAGEHEAIVDEETFLGVQERLQQNGRTGGTRVRNKHGALLKGLLVCGACGRAMTHTFTTKRQKRYRYYTCEKAIKCGRESCPSRSLPASEIEQAVIGEIRGIADDAGLRAEVLRQARGHTGGELAELQVERDHLQEELRRLDVEIRKLGVSGRNTTANTARMAEVNERIARDEARLAEVKQRMAALERDQVSEADVVAALSGFDALWEALSPREQGRVLALLVARVEFDAADESITVLFHPSAFRELRVKEVA